MALEKCCFCCKLENGVVIWGTFCVLSSICTFLFFCSIAIDSPYPDSSNQLNTIFCVMSIIQIISSSLLIVGAIKQNQYLMMPWIVFNGAALMPLVPIALLGALIAIPLYFPFYIWWCICSAYQNVEPQTQVVNNLVGHPTLPYIIEDLRRLRHLDQHRNTTPHYY